MSCWGRRFMFACQGCVRFGFSMAKCTRLFICALAFYVQVSVDVGTWLDLCSPEHADLCPPLVAVLIQCLVGQGVWVRQV
mmetsp:Transcript_124863/g.286103  ORF Transcript_124863/g.286103 Transcript_124863/m.286103 type:complete len:80 (-) Transcript_124863:57-296(-)